MTRRELVLFWALTICSIGSRVFAQADPGKAVLPAKDPALQGAIDRVAKAVQSEDEKLMDAEIKKFQAVAQKRPGDALLQLAVYASDHPGNEAATLAVMTGVRSLSMEDVAVLRAAGPYLAGASPAGKPVLLGAVSGRPHEAYRAYLLENKHQPAMDIVAIMIRENPHLAIQSLAAVYLPNEANAGERKAILDSGELISKTLTMNRTKLTDEDKKAAAAELDKLAGSTHWFARAYAGLLARESTVRNQEIGERLAHDKDVRVRTVVGLANTKSVN